MRKCALGILLFFILLLVNTFAVAAERPVMKRISAAYPELAKRMRVTGIVRLEAKVSSAGKVQEVKVVSGHPLLGAAAKDAVVHWEFAPADADSTERIDVEFRQ